MALATCGRSCSSLQHNLLHYLKNGNCCKIAISFIGPDDERNGLISSAVSYNSSEGAGYDANSDSYDLSSFMRIRSHGAARPSAE
jgi:hypothetical protein